MNDRGSPDGGHSRSISSSSMSHDSALPTTATLHSADIDDDNTDEIHIPSPSRSKSTDGRQSRINSAAQPFPSTASSVDRFKHGIRYLTDGFIRKISKQNNVSRIRSLNLSNLRDKKVRYIENLQTLINLENLDLSNNLIEKIDGFKTLKKLKSLLLANNFINTINNLEELSQLENLDLHQNQIHLIPIWFGKKLISLKILNLSNNQISSFDQITRLRTLYELRELYLHGNPIDQNEYYRLLIISYVPNLQRLDGIDITEDERKQAKEQFIQQEVQNLLHEIERRDNEYRRLNTQATNNEQQLEKTSGKLQSVENKSLTQAKEIKDLEERLAASEEQLQRKTSLLHQACEKQCKLEQELAFYKIDLKFDRLDFSKHLPRRNTSNQTMTEDNRFTSMTFNNNFIEDEDDTKSTVTDDRQRSASTIQWQTNEVQRILGPAPRGKLFHAENETIYNEKLLKLAFNISELTFLQAKQQVIEEHLQTATQRNESHAVIDHLSDNLNNVQTEMMNKISDVQELKLVLNGLRIDQGDGLGSDLEQVTIELKLDEVVRQHIIKLKQQSTIQPQEYDVVNESTFEQALTEAISSSGASVHDRYSISSTSSRVQLLEFALTANVEQLRTKEISEQEAQNKILELQTALEREQNQGSERIDQIEDMAEREKQRILKHLEEEKRFTRDIIKKSETMIDQLKRELSSERKHKTDEQKTYDALRDIYKKITPRQGKTLSKLIKHDTNTKEDDDDDDDDDDESPLDGERTVYHKDDPFLASTPRDRSLLAGRNDSSDYDVLRRQLEEQLKDDNDESLLVNDKKTKSNLTSGTLRSRLPPTPKRQTNTKFHSSASSSFDKTHPTIIKLDPTLSGGDEEDNDLLYRLHGYVKTGQRYVSGLDDLGRVPVNDSGYSSQQTGRENNIENAKLQSLLSTQPFHSYNKYCIDPNQLNQEYTVGVVTRHTDQHQRYYDQSKVGNVTLYPTPEGYMLGPNSVTVSQETFPIYANLSPSQSITQTDSQFFACVNIPPDALSSNRPLGSSRDNPDEVRLQGPVVFRQDTVLKSENVSPISVKIRSLKFPQVEKSTMTDSDTIRREIDRTTDEIDYLKLKLQRNEDDLQDNNHLHLLKDTLEQQTKEIQRVKTIHQDMLNSGRNNEANLLDLSQQVHRIQRNVHEHLSPDLLRLVDEASRINTGKLIPLTSDEHWICNVPRHADLEEIIAELEAKIDEQRRQMGDIKHENRRLERSLVKKSIKVDALDLAASRKRSRSIADSGETESLQDDVFVLEQQLLRKQRDITLAQEQIKQMTSLSHNVVHDLKTARQRHSIAKRETKGLEQKIDLLTRKLYKLTNDTQQAEENFEKANTHFHLMDKEKTKLDKIIDEKRALTIVLDEQLRASFNSFNSLLNSSIKCLQELTSATTTIEDEFRFHSLPPPPLQMNHTSSTLSPEEIQRQISHIISENNRILSRYHMILQQQKQKSTTLKNEINEKETILTNVKADLDAYNEQLRRNAQELLQDKNVLEELERVKDHKSDKLTELERLIERRQTQEKHSQHEIEQLTTEQQRLKKQYKDALSEHDQLQHNIEADRQILTEMKNESIRLREQIKSFLDDKETLDETCDLLAKKCEALHNECKEKETNLPSLVSQIDEKLTVCKNLEDEIKKLKSDKTRCLEEVTEMKEKIERKRIELGRSPNENDLEHQNEELKQRIKRHEHDLDRLNNDIDERNRTLNELNTMIAYAKNIMKNVQPNENHRNYTQNSSSDFPILDQRHQQENTTYYETKIQRLTKALDDKEQDLRSLNMQLITTKDELSQMQYKVQNQESNADAIRNSMQIELDKLRHWLQIYENRKAMLRPQYHETLKELEVKLHEQEMFYRKQIKDLDSEMKRKYHGRPSDDSGFFSDTTIGENRISPTVDTNDTSMLREQMQNIFSHHVQELDKCNSKYKTNLSNLKNRLHELENSTTTATNIRLDS